jgi:hypothetical protein
MTTRLTIADARALSPRADDALPGSRCQAKQELVLCQEHSANCPLCQTAHRYGSCARYRRLHAALRWWSDEELVVVAGEVALEAAHRLDSALALGFLALEVGACRWVETAAGDRDDVQCSVELAVSAAV